jgi:hypothetical protein
MYEESFFSYFLFQMKQNGFLVSNKFTDKFRLLHFFSESSFKKVNERPVGRLEILVLPGIFKLIIRNTRVCNRNSTLAPQSILYLHSIFSLDMLDSLSLKMRFDKVAPQVNCNGAISAALGHCFKVNVGD